MLLHGLPDQSFLFDRIDERGSSLKSIVSFHKEAVDRLSKIYPSLVFIGFTYKTNQFNFPVLSKIGQSSLKNIYFIGRAFFVKGWYNLFAYMGYEPFLPSDQRSTFHRKEKWHGSAIEAPRVWLAANTLEAIAETLARSAHSSFGHSYQLQPLSSAISGQWPPRILPHDDGGPYSICS